METERLLIDSVRETDKEDYFHNISHDRKVLETFICRYAETLEDFDFSSYPGREDLFAIRLVQTGRLIGIILYFDEDGRSCEIGYGIGSDYWGHGYATEAVRRFLTFLFREKGFESVCASFFTGNDASRHVMEKCGMTFSRFSEKELEYLGVERDLIYYSVDASHFLAFPYGSTLTVNGKEYALVRLLGKGKGGYSYLSESKGRPVVVKQIHHERCDYYRFGNKIESERRDYERLRKAGIRVPELLAVDPAAERIVKEYVEGPTVFELVRDGASAESLLPRVREMAALAKAAGLNIDYFPTNFVVSGGLLWYVDYECNDYAEEWDFENWGIRYWSRTPEFEAYLRERGKEENGSRDLTNEGLEAEQPSCEESGLRERIRRVTEMEEAMDRVAAALADAEKREERLAAVREDIDRLEAYLRTDWLGDYEADERGAFPPGMKRGVLAQDALYDLLDEAAEK